MSASAFGFACPCARSLGPNGHGTEAMRFQCTPKFLWASSGDDAEEIPSRQMLLKTLARESPATWIFHSFR